MRLDSWGADAVGGGVKVGNRIEGLGWVGSDIMDCTFRKLFLESRP